MLRRKLFVILASVFAASSASIEWKNDGEKWTEYKPFEILMSWYLKRTYTATVRVIHSSESNSMRRESSRFIESIFRKSDTVILVKENIVQEKCDEKYCKLPDKNGVRFNRDEHPGEIDDSSDQDWPNLSRASLASQSGGSVAILLIPDEATFEKFLNRGGSWRKQKIKSLMIIVIPESLDVLCQGAPGKKVWKESFKNILSRIWTEDKVLNIFLTAPTSECIKDYLFAWDPFAIDKNGDFGGLKRLKITTNDPNVEKSLFGFMNKMQNMNGYPLKVSIFIRPPTLFVNPKLEQTHNVEEDSKLNINEIEGVDGMVLKTLSSWMNCSVEFHPPSDNLEYGYKLNNGTFVGMVGDVVYRRVDYTANGIFLKDYGTKSATEFTTAISYDSMCIVVPRAGMIPEWLQIFQCFSPLVWNLLFLNIVVYGLLRHFVRRLLHGRDRRNNLLISLIETALIFFGSPQNLSRLLNAERILMGFYLLFNVIVIGTFQSTLYEGFTNTKYGKDYNTLAELDDSGLSIGTGSPNLQDIFGADEDSPILNNLRKKVRVFDVWKESTINRTAWKRDIAAIERKNDLQLVVSTKYLDEYGDRVLHVVDECPRSYNLAYMVPHGAFFLPRINALLQKMLESGLISYWYNSTLDSLILQHQYSIEKKTKNGKDTPFDLKNLQTPFIILATGLLLSSLVFLAEIFYFRYSINRGRTNTKVIVTRRNRLPRNAWRPHSPSME